MQIKRISIIKVMAQTRMGCMNERMSIVMNKILAIMDVVSVSLAMCGYKRI